MIAICLSRKHVPFDCISCLRTSYERSLFAVFFLLVFVFTDGCVGGYDEGELIVNEVETNAQPITNGQPHSGHPFVGELEVDQGAYCTATLIGKKTALCAAHCCIKQNQTFKIEGNTYQSSSVIAHPRWQEGSQGNDICVVILDAAPPVKPVPISTTAPTVNLDIVLVGYGATQCWQTGGGPQGVQCTNDRGVKRIGTNKIQKVTSQEFEFVGGSDDNGMTCKGDSGGPAFATFDGEEVQVGVTSRGDIPCGRNAVDTRVDAYVDWITEKANGDVVKQGETDDDPPLVKIISPADGAVVSSPLAVSVKVTDASKISKVELFLDGSSKDSRDAPPYEFQLSDLSSGAHLIEVAAFDEAGNKGTASVNVMVEEEEPSEKSPAEQNSSIKPGEYGSTCERGPECSSGLCAEDMTSNKRYCTQSCDPTAEAACPHGGRCMQANAGINICGPLAFSMKEPQLLGGCSMSQDGERRAGGRAWLLFFLCFIALGAHCWAQRRRSQGF